MRLIASSPDREAQIELLSFAASCLERQSKMEQAKVVQDLANKFTRPKNVARKSEPTKPQKRSSVKKPDRARTVELEKARRQELARLKYLEQLDLLEKRLAELNSRIEQVTNANKDLRQRMRSIDPDKK